MRTKAQNRVNNFLRTHDYQVVKPEFRSRSDSIDYIFFVVHGDTEKLRDGAGKPWKHNTGKNPAKRIYVRFYLYEHPE